MQWIISARYLALNSHASFYRAVYQGLGIQDWILKKRIFRAGYRGWIPNFRRAQLDIYSAGYVWLTKIVMLVFLELDSRTGYSKYEYSNIRLFRGGKCRTGYSK
jgi:hypothetical protein